MAEIILLRHGQASFGTNNYDRLSDLGRQQSLWLGEHLKHLGKQCDRVVMGAMERHRETTKQVLSGLGLSIPAEIHAGLNEYDHHGLLSAYQQAFPLEWSDTGHIGRDYYHNMKGAMKYWMNQTLATDSKDSWLEFCHRIEQAFDVACEGNFKRVLVVTSGGPISVILARLLGLDNERTCNLTVQIKNTSISTLLYNRVDLTLDSFNDVSHLQTSDRKQYITFY